MSENTLRAVASFSYPYEAQIAKANLESAGIAAYVADENTINMQWLYSDALGGVRVMVAERDFEQARELLGEDFTDALAAEVALDEIRCSQCGSSDLEPYTEGKRPAFLAFLLIDFPLFKFKHGYKCKRCGTFNGG